MISDNDSNGWSRGGGRSSRSRRSIKSYLTTDDESEISDDEFDDLIYQEIKKDRENKNGSGTMGTARKVFLLDQLKRPSPRSPNVPERKSGGREKSTINVKKKKRVDRRVSVDRLSSRLTGVCTMLEKEQLFVAKQMGSKSFWPLSALSSNGKWCNLRVGMGMLKIVSEKIRDLHEQGKAYGSLSQDVVLLDRNLDVSLEAPKTIAMKGNMNKNRMFSDVLHLGILLLEVVTKKLVSRSFCPSVDEVRGLETSVAVTKEKAERMSALGKKVEKEIREALKRCPRYIIDLCNECLQPNRESRPDAEKIFNTFTKYKKNLGSDQDDNEKLRILKEIVTDTTVVKYLKRNPKILGAVEAESPSPRKTLSTKHKKKSDGYESEDSYYVAPEKEDKKKKRKPNIKKRGSLAAFLHETNDTKPLGEKPSSASHSGERLRRKSRFSDFTDAEDDEPRERRPRRRSLDEDYRNAKRTLARDVKAGVGITSDNLEAFKEAWAAKEKARELKKGVSAEELAQRFEKQDRISVGFALAICKKASNMMKEEPNNLMLNGPVTVVGDIHGQFFDLRNLIKLNGEPGSVIGDGSQKDEDGEPVKRSYVFLGDYVDRGNFSCEVLLYLLSLKVQYQQYIWLLRGNHESRATCAYFGFKEECEKKYGVELFNKCCDVFQSMPLAATVSTPAGRFFCLHGGISPNVTSLHQFAEFDRFDEPDMKGFLCDVLWADPVTVANEDDADELDAVDVNQALGAYFDNTLRGCSYRFGLAALEGFLASNNLVSIVRAHQVQHNGYKYHYQQLIHSQLPPKERAKQSAQDITPPIITVFSAPNYCGTYDNKAAYISIGEAKTKKKIAPLATLKPKQFDAVKEPALIDYGNYKEKQELDIETMCPYLPNDANGFINTAIRLRNLDSLDELINSAIDASTLDISHIPDEDPAHEVEMAQPRPSVLKKFPSVRAEDPATWKSIAERTKEYQKAASKFKEAAKNDRLNEMNPMLLQKKKQKAREMLHEDELQLPSNIRIQDEEKRRRASQRLSRLQNQKEITFTKKELLALQALFLLIDREEKGKIGAFDIVLWAEGDGEVVSTQEAYVALEICDFDKDGFIGFEDYLVFAACAKKLWLAEKFAKILQSRN